jgi:hypothetical protein
MFNVAPWSQQNDDPWAEVEKRLTLLAVFVDAKAADF